VMQLLALTAAVNRLADARETPKKVKAETKAEAKDETPKQKPIAEIMDETVVKRKYKNTRTRHEGWASSSTMLRRYGLRIREAQLTAIANERGWELQHFCGRPYIKDENAEQIAEELAV